MTALAQACDFLSFWRALFFYNFPFKRHNYHRYFCFTLKLSDTHLLQWIIVNPFLDLYSLMLFSKAAQYYSYDVCPGAGEVTARENSG